MTVEKHLTYRGDIRAIVGVGDLLAFVTTHPESQPGGLYRLDADKLSLTSESLPSGAMAIVAEGESLWLAGGEGQILEAPGPGGTPKARGPKLDAPATALASLADGRLAALIGSRVVVLSRKENKTRQTLDLPEPGTCLATDPTGRWLAAGTTQGTVVVFDAEGKDEFLLSASGKLHDGAVTALLFEPDDLRFFSAGADLRLLSTHARGKLEPEDKGRANNHTDVVTSLIWGPGERLYSGSRDGSIKSWPRVGAVKPSTTRDGVGRVVALAIVTVHERPRLVAACDDNTLRFFPVDALGKIGESSHRAYDAYEQAKNELSRDDALRREAMLRALAGFGDARAVDLIALQVGTDADHALRLMAAELLGASDHPKASTLLEASLGHADEAVRVAAFLGLRRHRGVADLRPIDLALKAEKADVGRLAVDALATLAGKDDQALSRLHQAIDSKTPEIRQAALVALESAYDPHSPEPNLLAFGSKYADVRRAALVRLFRRRLLDDSAVQSVLRRAAEDADPEVRQTAFLLALHTRERLLQALRSRDPELERQLGELEGTTGTPAELGRIASQIASLQRSDDKGVGAGETPAAKEKPAKKARGKIQAAVADPGLEDADLEPLLQASASRALDTSLRGARGLAVLGDSRAFGLLLQLSREDNKAARAEVCRAMGTLDDPRAIERLRSLLHDGEAEVRDAAFTALARIHHSEPLLAAESGLNASHEDVRRRGLQALVAEARKGTITEPARQLLARALNDSLPAVRTEAFKSVLGLQVGGVGAGTLRFAGRSIHPDVRREVLTEVMAQVAEPWGLDLLLEFFNDPDPNLRGEAFAFALKKTKGLEFLEAALGSRFSDLRMKAVEGLVKKRTNAAQALLVRALDDEDKAVRLAALESLIDADALPALALALENAHPDVRLRAARALARHGDPRAFAPLVALATAPEPEERERRTDWLALAESALDGLGELGDPSAVPHLIPRLDSPDAAIRKQAARALARVARPETSDALRQALSHADPEVKYAVALGLVQLGDASVASLVFSEAAGKFITSHGQLYAAMALGDTGEDRLVVFLDNPKDLVASRALLLLIMREWKDPRGTPSRCLACLSSRTPRLRLTAARAIESFADPAAFASFVDGLVNDRGDKPEWKIRATTVNALAEMIVHGDHQLQVRSARLLRHFDEEEQDAFDQAWKVHEARFAKELAELARKAAKRKPTPSRETPALLQDLAFGAYVGLVRDQAAAKGGGRNPAPTHRVDRIRQTALSRLLELARRDARHTRPALAVFVQSLADPNQTVRSQAFEQAQTLGMPVSTLAAEALASGYVDLGVRGLELLTGAASEAEGRAVLEQAMIGRKDDLAAEAARLLIDRLGQVAVGGRALEAAHEPLRFQGVSWLAAEYDKDPTAREPLRVALGSRYSAVRQAAAFELANKKDFAAFEALVGLLKTVDRPKLQTQVIRAMETLGDPRAVGALIDRVVDDPAGTAPVDDLIRAVGRFRLPESFDRLMVLLDSDPKRHDVVFEALVKVAGYDQRIDDPDDERPEDRRWEKEQHPRRDDLLALLLDRLATPGDAKLVVRLLPGARWARGQEVTPPLGRLAGHPDETVRRQVVEALGWRLRKREGDPEPLRQALGHRDPVTQFLAAEGLARAGRGDGLNVLLAIIDFVDDLDHRRRAVRALGELADERAFELLLKLASEDGHALQEPAAEAIGHMGRSPRVDEVFKLLERRAKGDATGVAQAALWGLRWLDTGAGWQVIRDRAADGSSQVQDVAVELLGYDDNPATRDLLLRLLGTLDPYGFGAKLEDALVSARRTFGPDSLEPDYAVLQNESAAMLDEFDQILGRVRDRGEPARIFAILPGCPEEALGPLRACLLDRTELPLVEAKTALESADPSTAGLAAHILGRAGEKAIRTGPAIAAVLSRWRATWEEKRSALDRSNFDDDESFTSLTACVRDLAWAAGRLGVSSEALATLVAARPDDPAYRPIRREAVLALASAEATPKALDVLEAAAQAGDPEVRAIAAQAIARLAPDRARALAERLLTDAIGFRRLALEGESLVDEVAPKAVRQVHYQGVVLPGLIERGDVATLAAVAEDRTLPETTRLGALEGLGAMAREPSEAVLRRVGTNERDDEELRKAAWRCLSRSKRARAKAAKQVAKAEVGS